jgi:hypothetical protein
VAIPSFYFTLFKKFQVLGHVPAGTNHGVGVGGFNLNNPAAVFGTSDTGSLLASSNTPADSPLWAVLNSRAMGNPGFSPVFVGGGSWPAMPAFDTPAWLEFQVNAPAPKLVPVFGDWITAGKINDIPNDAIAEKPPAIVRPRGGGLFVCNLPGDNGTQPVPANYWATSLIFLLDPSTGAIANPPQFAASAEYYLTAIVGNAGTPHAGRFMPGGGPKIECEAWVMVWNTGFSPAVKLPSLGNLDIASKQRVFEVYFLKAGAYDLVGFRLPVQTVFDGLVQAIEEAEPDLGGLTATEWIHQKNAHLCAKVMIRKEGDSWPAAGDTPLDDRRIAQKNVAPFAIDLNVDQPDPNIEWTHFIVGDARRFKGADRRVGTHLLSLEDLARHLELGLYLALPRRAFDKCVDQKRLRGFEKVDWHGKAPFPEHVVLKCVSPKNSIPIAALGDRQMIGAALGIEYRVSRLERGQSGKVSVVQRTILPVLDSARQSYQLLPVVVGGVTVEVVIWPLAKGPRLKK